MSDSHTEQIYDILNSEKTLGLSHLDAVSPEGMLIQIELQKWVHNGFHNRN